VLDIAAVDATERDVVVAVPYELIDLAPTAARGAMDVAP
jgi:hypothetical protein